MNKERFEWWRTLPETNDVIGLIDEEIKIFVDALSSGQTIDTNSIDATVINTAIAVGRIKGLRKLRDLEHEGEENAVS